VSVYEHVVEEEVRVLHVWRCGYVDFRKDWAAESDNVV
jgi:hypothetical protein